jgi:hypothetical protein
MMMGGSKREENCWMQIGVSKGEQLPVRFEFCHVTCYLINPTNKLILFRVYHKLHHTTFNSKNLQEVTVYEVL